MPGIGDVKCARWLTGRRKPTDLAEARASRPEAENDGFIGSSEAMRTVQKTIGILYASGAVEMAPLELLAQAAALAAEARQRS